MRIVLNNLKIELENQEEIQDFWNIVMFALDLHNEKAGTGEPCMTESELELAKKLKEITEKSWNC